MKYAVPLALALCTGCMPVVQHGPWVQRGTSGAIGGTVGVSAELEEGTQAAPFFSFEGGMHFGITANDSSHEGASIGVQLPLIALLATDFDNENDAFAFLQFLNVDGYVTGPEVGGLSTAAGVTASNFHFMPYVQAGSYDDWYGTLAVSYLRETDVVLIAPSYTSVRRNSPTGVTHATFTVGMGSGRGENIFMAGISLIFEFHRVRP